MTPSDAIYYSVAILISGVGAILLALAYQIWRE